MWVTNLACNAALKRLLVVLAAVTLATPAASLTGEELYRYCTQPKGSDADTICRSYIRGLADGVFLADILAGEGKKLCTDGKGIDPKHARLVIETFLKENPSRITHEAAYLAVHALYNAFGCKGTK
jgi:hypothetical protein